MKDMFDENLDRMATSCMYLYCSKGNDVEDTCYYGRPM